MGIYMQNFLSYLDRENMHYEVYHNPNDVAYSGKAVFIDYDLGSSYPTISTIAVFKEDDGHVHIWSSLRYIGTFEGREYQAKQVCDAMNKEYPPFIFRLDGSDVLVEVDITTDLNNVGKDCVNWTMKTAAASALSSDEFAKILC